MKLLTILALTFTSILAQAGPHLVFVIGEKEYGTHESLPAFFESDLKPAGYTATFITAPPEEGVRDDFSGLAKALKKADACFISARRRAPAAKDMQALKQFVADGKPLIAIRTSSHAFHLKGAPIPDGHELWEEFDPAILGGNYDGHYREEIATMSVAEEAKDHPIFKGLGKLPTSDKLYRNAPLAESTTLLLTGTIEGQAPEPTAWTNTVGDNNAKIFSTSLGQLSDFENTEFRKFIKNAIDWAVAE
tara:strand:+ start:415 stop:1158 length:744 start_codon:yes stop_codon:yes gene_type:complete